MLIEFDPAKNERNIKERGLDFSRVLEFDFATAEIKFNMRQGEAQGGDRLAFESALRARLCEKTGRVADHQLEKIQSAGGEAI